MSINLKIDKIEYVVLNNGVRMQSYFNEMEVGEAIIQCGIPREGLFITTKVWIDNYGWQREY